MQYIVLDHVERIRDSEVLAVLLRLRELTGMSSCDANHRAATLYCSVLSIILLLLTCAKLMVCPPAGVDIGLILISQTPWGSNCFDDDTLRCRRPHHLCFPAYKMQELLQVRLCMIPPASLCCFDVLADWQ